MAGLQRVPAPRVPFGEHGDLAAIGLIVVLTVLIAKPWSGASAPLDARLAPTARPLAATAEPTLFEAGYAYDQGIFGPFAPKPEWSLWPAGVFVTVLYVTREARDLATVQPSLEPEEGWPAMVTIGPGDHLLWLGMNTPLKWTVLQARVWRIAPGGARKEIPVVRLPSDWGSNFAVIGIPTAAGSDRLKVWARGSYDLEVTLDPGPVTRSVRIEIETMDPHPTERPSETAP